MSEKKMTKQEYLQIKSKLEARKAELLEIKKAGGKSWTESLQEELDNIAMSIADVEDKIDAIPATAKDELSAYKPAEGTEKMVHLSIVHGRRFNSMTGKKSQSLTHSCLLIVNGSCSRITSHHWAIQS